jgi:ferric-dicitrate binding protein FerR (iron transport regulator)
MVLLDAYLDGALSPDEKQELEHALLESDAARQEFWERASLHGWTYAAAKLNYGAKPAGETARQRRAPREDWVEALIDWLRRASRFGWKIVLAGAACAAAVLLWFGIRALQPAYDDTVTETTPEPVVNTNFVATLTRGTSVVWDGESNGVDIGSAVPRRWLHLKSGAVQIEFNSGARMILEGPAALELISPEEARLNFGKLSARVPAPAHGFKVYTPDGTVTDLGTEFGLVREKAQPLKLEVFEGKVEVATDAATRPRILKAGEGVQVNATRVQPLRAADHPKFLSIAELARRESAELRARYEGWRQAEHSLDSDPAMLVHLDFEDQQNADRTLSNHAAETLASSRAMVFGCDWGEGRWPEKGALEFNRANDRVLVSVPGTFQSLTYLAWLRVDSLPNDWNALALVDTFRTGETHWQIRKDGSLEFSVRIQGGKSGWDHLVSDPVVTRDYFGKWIQLAAVYDGQSKTMILYLNGRRVSSKTARTRVLTLGVLELGNWSPTAKGADANYRLRDFHGRMDEFALLSRALSDEEIRREYETGQPRETTAVAELRTPAQP